MEVLLLIIGLLAGAAAAALALWPRLIRARADLQHERALSQERLATVNDAQERLSASFKALSSEALQSQMAQLSELSRAQLRAVQAEAKGDLDQRKQAVEQLISPLKEQLGRVDAQLLRLDQERRESRGRLEAQLRSLADTNDKLRTETGALVTALRKPNARGQWGQMQLRNVVELAGMLQHCDFVEQSQPAGGENGAASDLIVKMPGGSTSSSTPRRRFGVLDAYQARDEEERQRHLRDHARLLRKHVKALADKAYWAELESAPDLVVMFLPASISTARRRGRPGADRGRDGQACADHHADHAARDAACDRIRLAAGACRRVRAGGLELGRDLHGGCASCLA